MNRRGLLKSLTSAVLLPVACGRPAPVAGKAPVVSDVNSKEFQIAQEAARKQRELDDAAERRVGAAAR
ncbi:MAG: hypothetical protein ACRC1K_21700 [Planctomycetia bacterium]